MDFKEIADIKDNIWLIGILRLVNVITHILVHALANAWIHVINYKFKGVGFLFPDLVCCFFWCETLHETGKNKIIALWAFL